MYLEISITGVIIGFIILSLIVHILDKKEVEDAELFLKGGMVDEKMPWWFE